jgi:hypothetical protein
MWLRQIVIRTGCEEACFLARGSRLREHGDRDVARCRVAFRASQDLVAHDIGQMQIEQDEIRLMLAREFEPEPPCMAASSLSSGRCAKRYSISAGWPDCPRCRGSCRGEPERVGSSGSPVSWRRASGLELRGSLIQKCCRCRPRFRANFAAHVHDELFRERQPRPALPPSVRSAPRRSKGTKSRSRFSGASPGQCRGP